MPDLSDIPLGRVHEAQQAALVRLQLFIVGEIHRILLPVAQAARGVLQEVPADEPVTAAVTLATRRAVMAAWQTFMEQYTHLLAAGMREAASLPYGTLAVYHHAYVVPALDDLEEARRFVEQGEDESPFWNLRRGLLVSAEQRRMPDGVQLSGRIWRLDHQTRRQLDQRITQALATGEGAWDLAKGLEQYLGAGADCPRWTSTRLGKLTKADIAGGRRTGLYTGSDCNGQGVAYNALRLARTEIAAAHHLATDAAFAEMPWVIAEQINLSPAHAEVDVCDEVVEGGENGDGVYEKGEIALPLHPHCLCFKTAVLEEIDDFVGQLQAWLQGQDVPALDSYQTILGGRLDIPLLTDGIAVSLAQWLWEDIDGMAEKIWQGLVTV